MQIVINKCYGGFGLSRKALHRLRELGCAAAIAETDIGEKYPGTDDVRKKFLGESFLGNISRYDELLIQVVNEMGDEANGDYAKLRIVEIPNGIAWEIDEYDGMERIVEQHQSWG